MGKRRLGPIVKKCLLILLVIATLAASGLAWFVVRTFSTARFERQTDAIVVLTGGRGRVEEGIRLYRDGRARWLLLSGVDPSVRKGDLYRDRRGESRGDGILLEKSSRTTLENALYAREMLSSRGVRSLQLITSRYHLPRAHLIFRQLLPREVAIHPYPVESPNLSAGWWRRPAAWRLLFSEAYKYWLFRGFFLIAGDRAGAMYE